MLNLTRYTDSTNNITKFIVWFMNENAHGGKKLLHSALEIVNIKSLRILGDDALNLDKNYLMTESQIDELVEDAYFVTGAKIISIEDDIAKSTLTLLTTFLGHKGYPGGEYDKDMGTCNLKFDRLTFVLLMSEYMSLLNSGKYKSKEFSDDEE
jgi:hypothetical protein